MRNQRANRRRWRAPAVAGLALIAGLGVAACSSQGGSGGSSSGKITLTEEDYYTSGSANTFWNATFAEYHKLHPNVTIKRSSVPENGYVPHLLNQAGGGSLPNIVMIDNPYVAQFAAAGVLMPIKSVGQFDTSDITPALLHNGMYKGKLYAVPPYVNTIALAYNKKMFAAAHLSPPKTWSQLISDAKKLTTSKVYGFVTLLPPTHGQAFWEFAPFLWSNAGADAIEHVSSPQSVAALNVFVQMAKDGSMPKDVVSWQGSQDTEYFEAGKAAMLLNGSWMIPTFDAKKGLSYGTVEIPTRVAGQKLLVPTGGETFGISQSGTTAQQKASLAFLRWLMTPQEDAKAAVQVGGLIPTVKSAVPLALAKEDKTQMQAYAAELQKGGTERTQYAGTAYNNLSTTVGNAIDAAVLGQKAPAQAFQSIASTVSAGLHGSS